ncbi:hypothetical protein NE237_013276 [Protea cynaroides]|uniref:Uncharacterized protein n=1 Tax=Protea cynaroides TaxID=273540 RepID=A0A9Q0K012_9MAGN|nr:hypothetical protein NE237_013276 [Protea cynaroides]
MGHLIPLVAFAKQFVHHRDFFVRFTIPSDSSPTKAQNEVLDNLPKSIDTIFLSPVNLYDLSKVTNVETRIYLTISHSLSSLRKAFEVLTATTPIAALIVDLFGSDAFDVAIEFNVPSYIFLPSSAMLLSLYLHFPKLDEMHSCSGGALSWDQLSELALGLELSEQRFLWVVKNPNTIYLGAKITKEENPLSFLPKSFLERNEGRAFVVRSWAPQIQVLSHDSTGGFLIHCGWNSTLESVVHGIPLIAWPLFAEQKMNAMMLVEDLKNGIEERIEIAKVVRCLMEGDEGKRHRRR